MLDATVPETIHTFRLMIRYKHFVLSGSFQTRVQKGMPSHG